MSRKIAAMQPYLFPYLGYFQLIAAADAFVIGDNLQYVKESWINRNRILVSRQEKLLTFPLKKSAHTARINERFFADDFDQEIASILARIATSYRKAPCFKQAYPLLESVLRHDERNLSRYAEHAIASLCAYIGIDTPLHTASRLGIGECTDKQDRVVRTVSRLGGTVYINPIGGLSLYDADYFRAHGIELLFHKMGDVRYRQFGDAFHPSLSIIDVLMFNSREQVRDMLGECEVQGGEHFRQRMFEAGHSLLSTDRVAV